MIHAYNSRLLDYIQLAYQPMQVDRWVFNICFSFVIAGTIFVAAINRGVYWILVVRMYVRCIYIYKYI